METPNGRIQKRKMHVVFNQLLHQSLNSTPNLLIHLHRLHNASQTLFYLPIRLGISKFSLVSMRDNQCVYEIGFKNGKMRIKCALPIIIFILKSFVCLCFVYVLHLIQAVESNRVNISLQLTVVKYSH